MCCLKWVLSMPHDQYHRLWGIGTVHEADCVIRDCTILANMNIVLGRYCFENQKLCSWLKITNLCCWLQRVGYLMITTVPILSHSVIRSQILSMGRDGMSDYVQLVCYDIVTSFPANRFICLAYSLTYLVNSWKHLVCTQHCSYWWPGAKAPGHQYPQCWPNIHCTGPISDKDITLIVNFNK